MTVLKIAFYMLMISGVNTTILAEPFQLTLKNQGKVLEVSLGNTKLPLKASEAWNRMQDDTYTFEGDLEIGDAFSMTTVTATVGPDGGAFSTGAGECDWLGKRRSLGAAAGRRPARSGGC